MGTVRSRGLANAGDMNPVSRTDITRLPRDCFADLKSFVCEGVRLPCSKAVGYTSPQVVL